MRPKGHSNVVGKRKLGGAESRIEEQKHINCKRLGREGSEIRREGACKDYWELLKGTEFMVQYKHLLITGRVW